MFKEYFDKHTQPTSLTYQNYKGIKRKDYPKWVGWRVINNHKKNNISIGNIMDTDLELMVINFYKLKYIQSRFI